MPRVGPHSNAGTIAVVLLAVAMTRGAHAHPIADVGAPPPDWNVWTWTPWVVLLMVASALAYANGVRAMWRQAGKGKGIRSGQALAFVAGWLSVALALLSPLDALSAQLFSAHMLQHELLMVVAAPLLVSGRPLAAFAWAVPARHRRCIVASVRGPAWLGVWHALTWPPCAWALHGIVLWAWHLPLLFDAALRSTSWHTLQHASFLVTALLFWWEPLGGSGMRLRPGPALLYLFTTMLHTAALGALLTLSPALWYAPYGVTAPRLGIDALEDQQLGGLVMWVPSGMAYLGVALSVMANVLKTGRLTRARLLTDSQLRNERGIF